MKNKLIDAAIVAYQAGNEQAFSDLYRDWLSPYLKAFINNASTPRIGMNQQDLESLAHAATAHACRTWRPDRKACFKTWLCMIWRQRLCNAIHANQSGNAVGRRLTSSLDQMIEGDDGEFRSGAADPLGMNPAEILMALETIDQGIQQQDSPRSL